MACVNDQEETTQRLFPWRNTIHYLFIYLFVVVVVVFSYLASYLVRSRQLQESRNNNSTWVFDAWRMEVAYWKYSSKKNTKIYKISASPQRQTNEWCRISQMKTWSSKITTCIKIWNDKLILTARRWRSKQKNKTKNTYLKKFAQHFGLKTNLL